MFNRKNIKCTYHKVDIEMSTYEQDISIYDTYSTKFTDSFTFIFRHNDYYNKRNSVSWYPNIDNDCDLYRNITYIEDNNDKKYTILGPKSCLNIDEYVEPLKWISEFAQNEFSVFFMLTKTSQQSFYSNMHSHQSYSWRPYISIMFSNKIDLYAFKLKYFGHIDDLTIKSY